MKPADISVGVPLQLLFARPDVVQTEMALAAAYYSTNQSRAAFYPSLTIGGYIPLPGRRVMRILVRN